MLTSKLSRKSTTTIPKPVRTALRLHEGDELAYEIDGTRAILTKADETPVDDAFRAFTEWDSDADRRGYADLSKR